MNKQNHIALLPNKSKQKKRYRCFFFKNILNFIGRRKHFIDCFCCGDNLWWKKHLIMAFTKHKRDERPIAKYTPEMEDEILEQNPRDPVFLGRRSGVSICMEGFINKSEEELIRVFETVIKPSWMKGESLQEIDEIKNYSLLLPIRTLNGTFKKEMTNK